MFESIKRYFKNDPQAGVYVMIAYTLISGGTIAWMILSRHWVIGILVCLFLGLLMTFFFIWREDYWVQLEMAGMAIKSLIKNRGKKNGE